MASILDRYGIKEVADLTIYEIDQTTGDPTIPVLYIDTAKVSTIEQTAESTSARGGKGNPELIMWDYGKEITLNIEDALFSQKSMALMFGTVPDGTTTTTIYRVFAPNEISLNKNDDDYVDITINGQRYCVKMTNIDLYGIGDGRVNKDTVPTPASKALINSGEYDYGRFAIRASEKTQITINSDTFPGTYYITGDTYVRNEVTGDDDFFQFIVPKAKMQSEVTLTMEAEGDPTTFTMNMKVLRPKNKEMIKLVQYQLPKDEVGNLHLVDISTTPEGQTIEVTYSGIGDYVTTTKTLINNKVSAFKGAGFEDEIELEADEASFGDDQGEYLITITNTEGTTPDHYYDNCIHYDLTHTKAIIHNLRPTQNITITIGTNP